jgi:signal transduction histidine kinase
VPPRPRPIAILYWSLIVTTVLAALLLAGTIWLAERTRAENDWVRHTLAVRNQIEQILILVQRTDSNARGYLLTDNPTYFKTYKDAVAELPAAVEKMSMLVVDNPVQREAIAALHPILDEKLKELRTFMAEETPGHTGPLPPDQVAAELQTIHNFRDLIAKMVAEEDRLLALRQRTTATFGTLLQVGAGTSFILICAVGILVGFATRQSFFALATARDQLMVVNRELLEQINLRETAEDHLRQVQKMEAIGQLTGGIAHDFNNMLGVISGSLDLAGRHIKKGNFAIERFMESASKAADRAAALTHRLLAFARQQPLAPQPLDANKMITTMSDLLRSTLGEHISIETVSAAGLWRVKADALQLENAILNIAINARDAMGEGGRLTIETANAYLDEAYCRQHGEVTPGQYVMVAISDTGMGMKPEIAARVFEPFFTTKPEGVGTGLGLSQVYGFVKQSRGHIKIYSELGDGTTVKIYLPRLMSETQESPVVLASPLPRASGTETILVVEDDPLMRRMTTEALRELGYAVIACEKAVDALNILDQNDDIALLFTDVVMPEMNGKRLADEAQRRRPTLKVIFTTGYTQNAVVHGGVLDPGVHFLAKPFTLDQLAAKVRGLLDS